MVIPLITKFKTMFSFYLAIILALTIPAHPGMNRFHNSSNQVKTMDDTGGDTGEIPPTPPPPPHR
jgi:hypothetical protein